MLTLALYGLLAVAVIAGIYLLAAWLLPAGEQIAPPVRDEPIWSLPAERALAASDVAEVRLPVALRGYRFAETDLLLDRLVEELQARDDEIARLRSPATAPAPGTSESGERGAEHKSPAAPTPAPATSRPDRPWSLVKSASQPAAAPDPGVDAVSAAAAKSRIEAAPAARSEPAAAADAAPVDEPKPAPDAAAAPKPKRPPAPRRPPATSAEHVEHVEHVEHSGHDG